jgi:hypothetical protein
MDQREKTPDRQKKKKSHRGHGCLSLVSVVCCQVEVSATGWSVVQRSPSECGVSNVCAHETSKRGGLGTRKGAVEPYEKKNLPVIFGFNLNVEFFLCSCVLPSLLCGGNS